jgi:hypothetical protein
VKGSFAHFGAVDFDVLWSEDTQAEQDCKRKAARFLSRLSVILINFTGNNGMSALGAMV